MRMLDQLLYILVLKLSLGMTLSLLLVLDHVSHLDLPQHELLGRCGHSRLRHSI